MPSFKELLVASESELAMVFHNVPESEEADFIKRINTVARQLGLNHSQLVCALGFNKNMRDLSDICNLLGLRNYKLLTYRTDELFSTDTYQQLSIDNILDIYSEILEDETVLANLRKLIQPRLQHIEEDIDKNNDPSHVISYRMEIHSIYNSGVVDKSFAEERLKLKNGAHRLIANETNVIIEVGYMPPSNLFFMDSISVDEKRSLLEQGLIENAIIKNRLQNTKIKKAEREMLEEFL